MCQVVLGEVVAVHLSEGGWWYPVSPVPPVFLHFVCHQINEVFLVLTGMTTSWGKTYVFSLDGRLKQYQEAKSFLIWGLKHLPCTKCCELISLSQGYNFSPHIFRVTSRIILFWKPCQKLKVPKYSQLGDWKDRGKRGRHTEGLPLPSKVHV